MATSETTSMLVAGFGVVGTLLAALLTQWASHRHEERRWQREERTRWHGDRQESYLRFLVAVDRVQAALRAVLALRVIGNGSPQGGQEITEVSGLFRTVGEQENELFERLEEIKLLGSPGPVEAAARVFDAYKTVNAIAPKDPAQVSEGDLLVLLAQLRSATDDLITARKTFRTAARQELGIDAARG